MSAATLTAIGELIEPVTSWVPERDDPAGAFSYIDLSAVDQDNKVVAAPRKLACADAPSRARQKVRVRDVLVSTVRPNLNGVAQVPPELDGATASTGFCVLRASPSALDHRYLYQWVKSPRFVSDMVRKATGASYPAVSDRIVAESTIPLPSLAEQERIAAILDKADALRAKRRAAIAKLDELTQSIFLDMFGDPATNPKGWPLRALSTCTVRIQIGPFGSQLHQSDYVKGGVPLANPKHIRDGAIVVGASESVRAEKFARLVPYQLQPGDVVMGRRGEMGRCAIVSESLGPLLCGTGSLYLRPDQDVATSVYLSAVLSSAASKTRFERASLGQTLPNLNAKIVENFRIPLPPVELQDEYARCLREMALIRKQFVNSRAALHQLFASLQQRAFRGEL